jgi:hypothetical protein
VPRGFGEEFAVEFCCMAMDERAAPYRAVM